MNADCLEYDVQEYRDTRPWPAVEVMEYGGTTIAVERGRVEPSQAKVMVNLRKAESSLVLSKQKICHATETRRSAQPGPLVLSVPPVQDRNVVPTREHKDWAKLDNYDARCPGIIL
jgi:hypothetical protein